MFSITIESFGVPVRLESTDETLLQGLADYARLALAGHLDLAAGTKKPRTTFSIERSGSKFLLFQDGKKISPRWPKYRILGTFDSSLRLTIAEYAVNRVFIHAGVIGWKGKAILFPAKSYSGKTTLVAELVRAGAQYYSDEYAVLDEQGFNYPFARRLSVRVGNIEDGTLKQSHVSIEEIGGIAGNCPLPVGMVISTSFEEGAIWEPQSLSSGQGVMELLSHVLPIRYAPEFSLKVLKNVATNAIILKSPRYDAQAFASFFLDFVDNTLF